MPAFLDRIIEPEMTLDLIVGVPRLLVLKEAPKRVELGGDDKAAIAGFNLITEKELSLFGKKPGQAILNLWFADAKDPEKQRIVSLLLRIAPDPQGNKTQVDRIRRYYDDLEAQLRRIFPDSRVCLNVVGDKLVVTGQARDTQEAAQILQILSPGRSGTARNAAPTVPGAVVEQGLDRTVVRPLPEGGAEEQEEPDTFLGAGPRLRLVNLLNVPGEQQVMLKVVVAEINRAAVRSLGLNYSITNQQGITVFRNNTGSLVAAQGGVGNLANSAANIAFNLSNGNIFFALNALKTQNLARALAEPNLVALNGKTASFQAGGQFPVPVVTGFTAAGLQGVTFVPFGVQLNFTPMITDKDRIRLEVAAEVSTRDLQASANVGNTSVPGLNTRNFRSTVEMREGETLAVAGLLQTNYGADATRVPFLGDLPILGKLTGFERASTGEQELLILVTPMLVHPLRGPEQPPIPGSDVFEPNDLEFFVHGRLESHHPQDYRTPARTDIHRIREYRWRFPLFNSIFNKNQTTTNP